MKVYNPIDIQGGHRLDSSDFESLEGFIMKKRSVVVINATTMINFDRCRVEMMRERLRSTLRL